HDLANRYSDTGQFADILSLPADPPWLVLHDWLLDDWGFPQGEARRALERHLSLAMVATFAAVHVRESALLSSVLDVEAGFDSSAQRLEQVLHDEATAHLAHLFPPASPFWEYHRKFMDACAQALANPQAWLAPAPQSGERETLRVSPAPAWLAPAPPFDDELNRLADRLAFAKIPLVAVALYAGKARASQLPALLDLFGQLGLVFQILREALSLQHDAHRRHLSYPIIRAMHAAGIEFSRPVSPERLLGAALLTGVVVKIARECLARLERCRASALALDLPTLNAYLSTLEDQWRELMDLFSVEGVESTARHPGRLRLAMAAPHNGLAQAIVMAEAYLVADRTFRESWEVQRRGIFDSGELIGRIFAPGLILETLCQHRADMAGDVSALLDALADSGFRYYPHPAVPPDADDLGLALRLYSHSTEKARHREQLQKPLRWMEANISATGQIPCWFTRGVEGLDDAHETVLWGNQCATVEANLLLGLIAYDPIAYRAVIESSAAQWLRRWRLSGLGANALYDSAYALWTALRLLNALSASMVESNLRDQMERVMESAPRRDDEAMVERLRLEARDVSTPQAAAFLTLACLDGPASPAIAALFNPGWINLIVKRQRYDGSWASESLFVTPTRGEMAAWYSSRSVTTAYCWHALKVYEQWRVEPPAPA
ncbi:MAG: hypothetical protein ACT4QE_17390, partial [Anaerolineales bacterium]